jgi:predicted aconitase
MDPHEQQERRYEARGRLREQRRRVGRLRVRVATIAVTGFVALWGVVFVQMATGHDPVLGATSTTKTVRQEGIGAAAAAAAAVETTDPEELEVEKATPDAAEVEFAEPEPEPELPPVTTSQS